MFKATYKLITTKIGAEVVGLNLANENSPSLVKSLKEDLDRYKLLVIKNQHAVSAKKLVEVTRWFGNPETARFNHPRSPFPQVHRMSNNPLEGVTAGWVEHAGWHVHGCHMTKPSAFTIYHALKTTKDFGGISLAPIPELLDRIPKTKSEEWSKLWMMTEAGCRPIHPLIYKHPLSKKNTMCFHLGMISGFIYNFGTNSQRFASEDEVKRIKVDIEEEFNRDVFGLVQKYTWEEGDLLIFDNLSIAHDPWPDGGIEKQDLLIIHRTTVRGHHAPFHEIQENPSQMMIDSGLHMISSPCTIPDVNCQ